MTEKDKIIQDHRAEIERLHALIREYIEGVKNLTEENKALRRENAELRAMIRAENRETSDFLLP